MSSKEDNKMIKKIYIKIIKNYVSILFFIILLVSILFWPGYGKSVYQFWKYNSLAKQRDNINECSNQFIVRKSGLKSVFLDIYKRRTKSGASFDKSNKLNKDGQYWWVEEAKEYYKRHNLPIDNLYSFLDGNRDYPSSYIANPNLNVKDISEIPGLESTILVMDRKCYTKKIGFPRYNCLFADFTFRQIPEGEISRYKDW